MAETKTSPSTPTATKDENVMAAVAYILTWITGLIVFFTAKKEERFKRWHAIQAIGLGIAVVIVYIVLQIILMPLIFASAAMATVGMLLMTLVWIGTLLLIILLAVKAYKGGSLRLPVIAGFADKNA